MRLDLRQLPILLLRILHFQTKLLNVQPEFDPVISFARTARASRKVQFNAQQ